MSFMIHDRVKHTRNFLKRVSLDNHQAVSTVVDWMSYKGCQFLGVDWDDFGLSPARSFNAALARTSVGHGCLHDIENR